MMSDPLSCPADLRRWLEIARDMGEVSDVRGASWNLEIGDISHLAYQRATTKALLFDEIDDYPAGYRVLTASMSSPRLLGHTLGLGRDLDASTLVTALRGAPNRWAAEAHEYEPVEVTSGPVFANRVAGPDVDLNAFPVPLWHEGDGGRFVGTGCIIATSDHATGRINGGTYRIQVQDGGRTATISIAAGKHGARNVRTWFDAEGRAPVTISFGHSPLLLLVGGTDVPLGMSEFNYAGAIAGAPIQVAQASNGLPFPVHAEIVASGWIYPDRLAPEGPFGEWTGYYSESANDAYLLEIDELCYRDDPILLGSPPGLPPHDYSFMRSAMKSAMIVDALDNAGVAGVRDVWALEAGGGRILLAVSIDQEFAGHSRQVGLLTSQLPVAAYMNRYVVVVDSDVDVHSLHEVIWAICTRTDPAKDFQVLDRTWGSLADPLLQQSDVPYMSRAVIDACIPWERRDGFPATIRSDRRRMADTAQKWRHVLES